MRATLIATCVLAVAAGLADAAIVSSAAQGALKIKLHIDAAGNATLTNITGSVVNVDTYEIWSVSGKCSPTGWKSIADAVEADDANGTNFVSAALSSGAWTFGELSATTLLLSEGSVTKSARFNPSAPWGIGKPVSVLVPGDLTFYYSYIGGSPGDKFLGVVNAMPEPASLALLACGALVLRPGSGRAALRRRGRK